MQQLAFSDFIRITLKHKQQTTMPAFYSQILLFGRIDAMPFDLPSGWRWHVSDNDWLFAYDYEQRKYMVTKTGVRELTKRQNHLIITTDSKISCSWQIADEIRASQLTP